MNILIYGTAIFFSAFLLHILIWRLRLPKRQTLAILKIFMLSLLIGLSFGIDKGLNPFELIHISIFVISLTLAYIITYSGIEADSPSLVMIIAIADKGVEGLPVERFYELMSDSLLVSPRLDDMLRDGLAFIDNDKYILTKKGRLFAQIFINFRALLKIEAIGG
jgi:hypothetical protein